MTGQSWIARLEQDGFVHLPQVFDAADVDVLAAISSQSIEDYAESEDLVRTPEGTPVKLLYPLAKYGEFISMLGRKEVWEIVDRLIPRPDSVLTWEDVLIKVPSVGVEVNAHQDIGLDPVRGTIHSLGISLHADEDNPVFLLPGSHRFGPLTALTVDALRRDCRDRFRPVITQPGDIVIHNVHVIHFSEPNLSGNPRATWYLEFRSMHDLLEKGPWSVDWTFRRRAIWVYARAASGDEIGENEPDEVKWHLERLKKGESSFRVPHVTGEVRYDNTSPYNHFASWNGDWKDSRPARDGTHHLSGDGMPLYRARYEEVLKFRDPGLAPVRDTTGAYHITPDGLPAYDDRYLRTFGFYEGRAAVHSLDGWFHVLPDGRPLYPERHAWCGNFQEGRCAVRGTDGSYFHITAGGAPAYRESYRYGGDFRDGLAVVQRDDGLHSHIDPHGNLLHGRWFPDLDVFHKNHARAREGQGWHHVDLCGNPLYEARFRNVEPFYNGQARVEGLDGSLSLIGESGETLVELRGPQRSPLEELSADMVGTWKTQTIRAAVELGVFEALPSSAGDLEESLQLAESVGPRLMRALTELGLVSRDGSGLYHATARGEYLKRTHPLSLAGAALLWGGETYTAWSGAVQSLHTGRSGFKELYGDTMFDWLADRPDKLEAYHRALASYARHDYESLAASAADFGIHDFILDAGGGTGELAFALLRAHPGLTATVMDRPEVVSTVIAPVDVAGRCSFAGCDFFEEWPVRSDAVVLARVLHDWPDGEAMRILRRAREAMPVGGALYVVEMVLDDSTGAGGLLDLNMLVVAEGAERTEGQFRELLATAGFELLGVAPTGSVSSVIRARAV